MHALVLVLAFLAAPFWETKAPKDWTDEELSEILTDSPWAHGSTFLASAKPMQEAEVQYRLRHPPSNDAPPEDTDYEDFLRDNPDKYVVLAVRIGYRALSNPKEEKHMEDECVLKAGNKKYKMIGHFAPTPGDPYLRLVFPRVVNSSIKRFSFDLYLPFAQPPFQFVEFEVNDLTYHGKPAM